MRRETRRTGIRINWGVAITMVYVTFATATVSFVVFAVGRPVELVSADYYEQSLRHDAHRQAVANADALGDAVTIAAAEDAPAIDITIATPAMPAAPGMLATPAMSAIAAPPATDAAPGVPGVAAVTTGQARASTGSVTLYRPSDRTADRVEVLSLDDEGRQRIRVEGAAHGRWVVKLSWRAAGQDFYRERTVWLP